ncbi:MAG: cytochrome P450 [Gammaproteobacteria bacterium]|nr:cytochrome P450 [Gammaproteobacteria bacterium]
MPAASDTLRPPSPPSPSGWVARLRTYHAFLHNLIGVVSQRFETLGDIYYVPNADGGLYVIRHPEQIREVLITNAHCYAKTHSAFIRLGRVLGQGLLNTDGEVWRLHRRMIQPTFYKERLHVYSHMMVQEATDMIERWRDGRQIDLGAELTRLTLRIVSRSLFSHEVGDDMDAITGAVTVLQDSFSRPDLLPRWVPSPQRRKARRALRSIDEVMYRLIALRRNGTGSDTVHESGETADLLQRLIDARDEEGDRAGLSDKEIRDQLVTFFIAGHETTSHALTWIFYLLSQHPDITAKLNDEIERVLRGRPPRFEDFDALPYTEQIVKESMRLYPPVFAIARKAIADSHIGGYFVPAGSEVGIWTYMAHHDPRWFPRPEVFDPARFTDPESLQRMKNAYLPFGLGARTCIGKTFATIEAVLLLATVAQRYRLSLVPNHPIALKPRVTLMPKFGMKMIVHTR